jgi:hypothetical protein
MSKKRRQHDGERDPVVSEAYRELSQERTPAHLDHVVLNAARKAAKADRPREISWLRPAAWVTTIGLCLAIVLEITDPAPQDDAGGAPTSGHKELRGDAPALRQKRAETRATSVEEIPSRDEDVASVADSPLPTAAGREAAEALPGMPAEERKNVATAPVDIESFGRSDTMMLQDVEERSRTQEEPAGAAFRPPGKATSFAESEIERYCDEQDTSTPDTWVECIMRLQQEGRHDEVRFEHERLQETYPGADIPPLTVPLPDSP